MNDRGRVITKMDELLSYIEGPVITGQPVYDLRACLERLDDKALRWMLEMYQWIGGKRYGDMSTGRDEESAEHDHISTGQNVMNMPRDVMIEALISNITNPATISTLMKTENLMGFNFIERTVSEIRQSDGLWGDDGEIDNPQNAEPIEQLKKEVYHLDIEAHTYYPQYEGQFATEAEYEADRNQHYADINKKLEECWAKLEELGYHKANRKANEPAKVSLVLNSEVDTHFKTLQQAGLIFLFMDWDGKGRESGYHFGLDANWSELPKRERDDPWSGVYSKGRVVYNRRHLGDRLIGAQPFKPRQAIKDGVKTWTTEPGGGKKIPSAEEDVCLRLVVPVEVQEIVLGILSGAKA